MYFLRLAKLKPAVEAVASEAWDDFEVLHTLHVGDAELKIDEIPS